MDVPMLKSAAIGDKLIKMPSFDIGKALEESMQRGAEKSVKFAHSFDVELNTKNSGTWHETESYKIWRLQVASSDAYSLGLFFSKFHLPYGARMFIFDEEMSTVYGAYTEQNNKPYKQLAIYPFPADMVIIQYEEPLNAEFAGEVELGRINHDFLGVVLKNRFIKRPSGSCNVDVNCEMISGLDLEKRAVCRIISDDELGTATLLNTTANDGRPIVISAFHVFDSVQNAARTVFDFNYESPFCADIDGYDLQTISGGNVLAYSDSMDFMLLELSEDIPATFRPYYAGWDASGTVPSNSYTIHHPNGDVKKISHDDGVCDSITFAGSFFKNGHWRVNNWEYGTTESGSSGASLFSNHKVSGTLSGGAASCKTKSYDAFARLDKMWQFKPDKDHQIKAWLDPVNTGVRKLEGFDPFEVSNSNCNLLSNYLIDDSLSTVDDQLRNYQLNEIAERFTQTNNATIAGVALGIKRFKTRTANPMVTIIVYSGNEYPEFEEKMYKFPMSQLTQNAMNYFSFGDGFETNGNFFISVKVNSRDSIVFYQSAPRGLLKASSMLVKADGNWKYFSELDNDSQGASVLMQVNVCSADFTQVVDSIDEQTSSLKFYPNPASTFLLVEFTNRNASNDLSIYDLTGRLILNECYENKSYVELDVSGIQPGIYILNLQSDGLMESSRLVIR